MRISALEEQLVITARENAQEMSKLRTRLFELEIAMTTMDNDPNFFNMDNDFVFNQQDLDAITLEDDFNLPGIPAALSKQSSLSNISAKSQKNNIGTPVLPAAVVETKQNPTLEALMKAAMLTRSLANKKNENQTYTSIPPSTNNNQAQIDTNNEIKKDDNNPIDSLPSSTLDQPSVVLPPPIDTNIAPEEINPPTGSALNAANALKSKVPLLNLDETIDEEGKRSQRRSRRSRRSHRTPRDKESYTARSRDRDRDRDKDRDRDRERNRDSDREGRDKRRRTSREKTSDSDNARDSARKSRSPRESFKAAGFAVMATNQLPKSPRKDSDEQSPTSSGRKSARKSRSPRESFEAAGFADMATKSPRQSSIPNLESKTDAVKEETRVQKSNSNTSPRSASSNRERDRERERRSTRSKSRSPRESRRSHRSSDSPRKRADSRENDKDEKVNIVNESSQSPSASMSNTQDINNNSAVSVSGENLEVPNKLDSSVPDEPTKSFAV